MDASARRDVRQGCMHVIWKLGKRKRAEHDGKAHPPKKGKPALPADAPFVAHFLLMLTK